METEVIAVGAEETGIGVGRTKVDAEGTGAGVEATVTVEGTLVAVVIGTAVVEAVVAVVGLVGTTALAPAATASFSFPFPFGLVLPGSAGVVVPAPSPASVFRFLVAPPPIAPSVRRVRGAGVNGTDLSDGRRTCFAVGFFYQYKNIQ